MPISINSNTAALRAANNLQLTAASFTQAVQRLSSGLRINSAADDGAGLGISQKLIAQINGFDQAQRNAQDAVSLLQTAQTGLNESLSDLQRLNQLAIQASNSTLSSSDLQNIQLEVQGLLQDIDRVAQQTKYNTKALLNGALGVSVSGGGPDITNLQVQSGTARAGTYTVAAAVNATATAIQGNATGSSTFSGGGSITITGPTGTSQTFTSFAGETVSNFMQQVNDSNLGVTLQTVGGNYLLSSNNVGYKGADANGNTNSTGPVLITASGSGTDDDFGTGAGASLGLIGGTTGSLVAGAFNAAAAVNAKITLNGPGPAAGVVLVGQAPGGTADYSSDVFVGSGGAAGIMFRVPDPTDILAGDSFTVTQNSTLQFQVGANSGATIGLEIDAQTSLALGVNAINLTSQAGAEAAITPIQNAILQVTAALTNLGAIQNNLTSSQNLAASQELNMQTANSNLIDANVPQETIAFTRAQILEQAGTAVLAQANQSAGVLNLFNPSGPVL
jgi:flagellin